MDSLRFVACARAACGQVEAVAADAARLYPADQDGRVRHIQKLEKWIAHLGIGSQAA